MYKQIVLVTALAVFTVSAVAGERASVRVVEATSGSRDIDARLSDVASILKNLSFTSYSVLGQESITLPSDGWVNLPAGFAIRFDGDSSKLAVYVRQGGKALINTTATLGSKPLILGGFPRAGQTILLVVKKD